jgi:hypothetical protein
MEDLRTAIEHGRVPEMVAELRAVYADRAAS